MKQFQYIRPTTQQSVITALSQPGTKIIAGGSNLVDLMKHGVMTPDKLVDINKLPLRTITPTKSGLHIGALALNSQVA